MTAEVVNLRRARKAKLRADEAAGAAINRAKHGRTRGERQAQTLETDRAGRLLDGARIEREASGSDGPGWTDGD